MTLLTAECLTASDWPQWRGPERNAQSDEMLASRDWAAHPPKHLWTVDGFGEGYASVSPSPMETFTPSAILKAARL